MDDHKDHVLVARRILAQRLESLHRAGVEQLGRVSGPVGQSASARIQDHSQPASNLRLPTTAASSPTAPVALATFLTDLSELPPPLADRQQLLQDLKERVRACTLCHELACSRKQTVFGVGSAQPRVAF